MSAELYLITPVITDAEAFAPQLQRCLAAAPFSAVLIDCRQADDKDLARLVKPLVSLVQGAGAAALIPLPADLRTVARIAADGVHCADPARLGEAVEALKPMMIVGAGGLKTRHEAMEAGERDIDYILFGAPRADGSVPDAAMTLDRVQWWAGIFTLPCVAYAADAAGVGPLVGAGADFVALGPWLFDAADAETTVREAHALATARGPKK